MTFRQRQTEFEAKNKEKMNRIKKQMEPSFKPSINKKSKMLHKKMKSQAENDQRLYKGYSPK